MTSDIDLIPLMDSTFSLLYGNAFTCFHFDILCESLLHNTLLDGWLKEKYICFPILIM